jgi:hypothetical protein
MKIGDVKVNLTKVTYANTSTPKLTSISPRFGSVTGATTVTLTGTGFDTDKLKNTVLFDKVACVV